MPEPMRESDPDFVVVGSGPDATCSTTVRDGCCDARVIYPSPCNPAPNVTMSSGRSVVRDRYFWIPTRRFSYGSCPPYMRALGRTLEWGIKARDKLRYSCTHTRNLKRASWIKADLTS